MASSAPPSSSPSSPPLPPTNSSATQWEPGLDSVPDDVALSIAAFLGPRDLCSLGSSSRFLRRLSSFDCLWASLCTRRWPYLSQQSSRPHAAVGQGSSSASSSDAPTPTFPFSPPAQGWKIFYIRCHQEMAGRVSKVIKFVNQCSQKGSLEVGDYLKAVAALHSLDLGFVDIKFLLLTVKQTVLHTLAWQ